MLCFSIQVSDPGRASRRDVRHVNGRPGQENVQNRRVCSIDGLGRDGRSATVCQSWQQESFAVEVKSSHKIFCYLAMGSISQRVRTSPNLGLVLGETRKASPKLG